MASLNLVVLIGNLTKDPELRTNPEGNVSANFRIATNRKYKTNAGEIKEDTTFVRIVCFAKQAETCNQYLRKGDLVCVSGRLNYSAWEEAGQKRERLDVVANKVDFLKLKNRETIIENEQA